MKDFFIDSGVAIYAAGSPHPLKSPCRRVFDAAARREISLHASVECGQEFLYHRLRKAGLVSALADFDDLEALVTWHDFTRDVLRQSRDLVARGEVRGRDAVHAATAISAGFKQIVACDNDFDGITGLRRLDPADLTF